MLSGRESDGVNERQAYKTVDGNPVRKTINSGTLNIPDLILELALLYCKIVYSYLKLFFCLPDSVCYLGDNAFSDIYSSGMPAD